MIFFLIIFHKLYLIIQFGWALNYSVLEFWCIVNWCSLRSYAKDMTIIIFIIKPRQEMRL